MNCVVYFIEVEAMKLWTRPCRHSNHEIYDGDSARNSSLNCGPYRVLHWTHRLANAAPGAMTKDTRYSVVRALPLNPRRTAHMIRLRCRLRPRELQCRHRHGRLPELPHQIKFLDGWPSPLTEYTPGEKETEESPPLSLRLNTHSPETLRRTLPCPRA